MKGHHAATVQTHRVGWRSRSPKKPLQTIFRALLCREPHDVALGSYLGV